MQRGEEGVEEFLGEILRGVQEEKKGEEKGDTKEGEEKMQE